jgi:hypothetical protein
MTLRLLPLSWLIPSGLVVGALILATLVLGPIGVVAPARASSAAGQASLGVYVSHDQSTTANFVSALRGNSSIVPPAIIQDFFEWGTQSSPIGFPSGFASFVEGEQATPMITWQPSHIAPDSTTSVLQVINSGAWDSYITSWAHAARDFGRPMLVRLMHEMNGTWYPWGYNYQNNPYNTPEHYVEAFRHVVDIFKAVKADNVAFVWCAHTPVQADPNPLSAFFPDSPVPENLKWLALDGYNQSPNNPQSFTDIFQSSYHQLLDFEGGRPVMIAETATVELSSSAPETKAQWITSAFLNEIPQRFPKIVAALYFDAPGAGNNSYPISPGSPEFAAFQQVAQNDYWQRPGPG